MDNDISAAAKQLSSRLQGVVFAQQYLMLDYDCPASLLQAPRRSPPAWSRRPSRRWPTRSGVAVRAMVRRDEVNPVMDALAELGAKAILASDIRSCRL